MSEANMKLNAYSIFGLVMLALVGVAAWRIFTHKNVVPQHAILYDQSKSKIDGCSCLKGHAGKLIEQAKGRGELLTLFALGAEANGYQPKIVDTFPIPKNDSALGDKSKAKVAVEAFLSAVETACKGIPPSDRTPLHQGVKTILEQLRTTCTPDAACTLYVQSDMEEDVSPTILDAFKARKAGVEPDVPRLDNEGISVTFAGVSEIVVSPTKGKKAKGAGKDKALQKLDEAPIWKSFWTRIFTRPELVSFQPLCTEPEGGVASKTK
jgi:hypothetical protein